MPTGASVYSLTPSGSPSRSTVQSRGRTYSVKILGREVHTRSTTVDSNARTPARSSTGSLIDPVPAITPHDEKRILRLRQDPSVASLLDMYDTHGQLDADAFTSSPVKRSNTSPPVMEKRMSRQEKRLSSDVQSVLRVLIIGAPGYIAFESLKKYLQCQGEPD